MFNKKITYLLALIYLVELSVASTSQLVEDNAQVALDKVNITCAMNLTCIKSVTNELVSGLNQRKSINFGSFSIEPVENTNAVASARSSKFFDLINGNAIKIPFGPVSLSFQRSADYENYMEVAVLRKVEGRSERKQMRFFVPAFLVMSQVGWWMLAIAGVSLLSIKAFLVSKIALIIASVMTFKRLFMNIHSIPHYYEHPDPMVMPYNFDFSSFSSPSAHHNFDMNDFHPSIGHLGHEQTAALHHSGALGSETAINNVLHNSTSSSTPVAAAQTQQAAATGLGAYSTGVRPPMNFNYFGKNPSYMLRKP